MADRSDPPRVRPGQPGPAAGSVDAVFDEPPMLRRLGTLAELTRGDAGGTEDGNIGWSGDLGSV